MKHTGRTGWVASRKDTYSLDVALRPIIAAGLRKFIEVAKDKGVPGVLCEDDTPFEESRLLWLNTLEKMLYAFESKEPDINDFDFDFEFITDNKVVASIQDDVPYTIEVVGKQNYEKFRELEKEYEQRVQEGLDLFAKYYKNLWW